MSDVAHLYGFEFERLGADRFDLRIHGELPLGWSAFVAGNLSDRRFDVVTARATQSANGTWEGRVEGKRPMGISSFPPADDLLTPVALVAAVVPEVRSFTIVTSNDGKALEVTVHAADVTGLLATLLRSFGMLGLFPRSFDVRTVAGEADDRFVLSGIGGSPVSERAAREVERTLTRWQGRSSSETISRAD